jgi:sulfopropanediol 3-dehydrogenase
MMAFGLGDVAPVDVLCGTGNAYVVEAKRQLFGRCGIDMLAGPSEVLVIADDGADPALVASDLLGQAERDPHSGACLVCLSERFAREALAEVDRQLAALPTREVAAQAWSAHGTVYVADGPDEAIRLSDQYAPEHLELHVRETDLYFARLRNYGSLFIGEEATVAYGDNSVGTTQVLPTGRAARYTGGVWAGTFLKTCTFQRITPAASRLLAEIAERQSAREHMPAHGLTARARIERYR